MRRQFSSRGTQSLWLSIKIDTVLYQLQPLTENHSAPARVRFEDYICQVDLAWTLLPWISHCFSTLMICDRWASFGEICKRLYRKQKSALYTADEERKKESQKTKSTRTGTGHWASRPNRKSVLISKSWGQSVDLEARYGIQMESNKTSKKAQEEPKMRWQRLQRAKRWTIPRALLKKRRRDNTRRQILHYFEPFQGRSRREWRAGSTHCLNGKPLPRHFPSSNLTCKYQYVERRRYVL